MSPTLPVAAYRNLRRLLDHPFNRGRPLAALARVARWQVVGRLASGPVLVPFVLHALRPDELFVDIGANVGAYTVLAAAAGARVMAFEPAPETFACLTANLRANAIEGRVAALQTALGRAAGSVRFTDTEDTVNHVAAAGDAAGIEVPVTTLDAAVGGQAPVLIKMDVEGYETEVVAGAGRTLASPELLGVIMELNGSGERYGFDEEALHARMLGFGLRPWRYDGWARRLTALEGPRPTEGNTLYLRDAEAAMLRVRQARRFDVQGRAV